MKKIWHRAKERSQVFWLAISRRPFRWFFFLFTLIGIYDTFVAQLLPKKLGDEMPNMYDVAYHALLWVGSWNWWVWVLGLLATSLAATLEITFRLARKLTVAQANLQPITGRKTNFRDTPSVRVEDGGTYATLMFDGGLIALSQAVNITSVDDEGVGTFGFNFYHPLSKNYFVRIDADEPINWRADTSNPNHCRVTLEGKEPTKMRIEFVEVY